MLRQLGKPTFSLALSGNELRWPHLLDFAHRIRECTSEIIEDPLIHLTPSETAKWVNVDSEMTPLLAAHTSGSQLQLSWICSNRQKSVPSAQIELSITPCGQDSSTVALQMCIFCCGCETTRKKTFRKICRWLWSWLIACVRLISKTLWPIPMMGRVTSSSILSHASKTAVEAVKNLPPVDST